MLLPEPPVTENVGARRSVDGDVAERCEHDPGYQRTTRHRRADATHERARGLGPRPRPGRTGSGSGLVGGGRPRPELPAVPRRTSGRAPGRSGCPVDRGGAGPGQLLLPRRVAGELIVIIAAGGIVSR